MWGKDCTKVAVADAKRASRDLIRSLASLVDEGATLRDY